MRYAMFWNGLSFNFDNFAIYCFCELVDYALKIRSE